MKGSIGILIAFVAGILLAANGLVPQIFYDNDYSIHILGALLFSVGVGIGYEKKTLDTLRRSKPKILLVPLATIVGTLLGTALVSYFTHYSALDCMAVGSGFGYYSFSSIFITQHKGIELGTVALASNVLREIFTLLFAPLLVMYFGKLAPIVSGGATTMDTTLPVIAKYSGSEFIIVAIVHGFLIDLSVPFLVTLFCTL